MVISMKRDDIVSVRGGLRGMTVRWDTGRLWVTVVGDNTDYILSSGKELTVSARRKVVIMAESGSTVRLFRPFSTNTVFGPNMNLIPRNEAGLETRSC